MDITTSREKIRYTLLTEYAKQLSIDKQELDTSDTSFNTYVINVLSYLVSDLLVYSNIVHRESCLVTAELPDSVKKWATYIGYQPKFAIPATAELLIKIPIDRPFYAKLPYNHKFTTNNNIIYRSLNNYSITVDAAQKISVIKSDPVTNTEKVQPFTIITENDVSYLTFLVDTMQYDIVTESVRVPTLAPLEFFFTQITLPDDTQLYSIDITSDFENKTETWKQINNIILLKPEDYGFMAIPQNNGIVEVVTGNGIFGKQPEGTLNITTKVTLGPLGNVITGTSFYGDQLQSEYEVNYLATAVNSTKGQNAETLDEIKRNAIISLRTLSRIVTQQDYKDIATITNKQNIMQSLPVLKRSDLTTNDIFVYFTLLDSNNQIVKTNSIAIETTKHNLAPFQVFTSDNTKWVCPFSFKFQENNIVELETIPLSLNLNIVSSLYSKDINIINVTTKYNISTDSIDIYVTTVINDTVDISLSFQELQILKQTTIFSFKPVSVKQISPNSYNFIYNVNRNEITDLNEIRIVNTNNNQVISTYISKTNVIKTFTYCDIITYNNKKYILDVPVINLDYWNTLTDDEKSFLISLVYTNMYNATQDYDYIMSNVQIRPSFIKTYGSLTNIKYSTPDYIVSKIITQTYNLPDPALFTSQYIAVSSNDYINDQYPEYSGHLLVSDGQKWKLILVGRGTVIKIKDNPTDIYITNGHKWLQPHFTVPLKIIVEVYLDHLEDSASIINTTKEVITEYINTIGIEESLYISKLIDVIQNIDNVKHCRIIFPETDIIFRDILKNLTSEQLQFYTPELVYTTPENITVNVML